MFPALALIAAADPEPTARRDAALRLLTLAGAPALDDERWEVVARALAGSPAELVPWLAAHHTREPARALALARVAFDVNPARPEWLAAFESWLGDTEPLVARITRYETALKHTTDRERRVPLLRKAATLRATAGDGRGAARQWQQVLAEDPTDREAAEHLLAQPDLDRAVLELIAQSAPADARGRAEQRLKEIRLAEAHDDWSKLPDVLGGLLRSEDEATRADGIRRLLDLEKSATDSGATREFAALLEVATGLAPADWARELARVRARVLAADGGSQAQASLAYRQLVEAHGDDEDVRAFEAFVAAHGSAIERHEERRWLFRWRADRGPKPGEPSRAEVLLEWARAEDEFGEADAAMVVYQRLAALEPGRREAIEALYRLKMHAGDVEGGLDVLRSMRDAGPETERRAVAVRMARLLLEEMDRPAEAAAALVPLFEAQPPVPEVEPLLRRTLADAGARAHVVERLEKLVETADRATQLRTYAFLSKARRETAAMPEARRRWYDRRVALEEDPAAALQAAAEGVLEFPGDLALWETAETIARSHGLAEGLSRAYHRVLAEAAIDPDLAERLARRMLAFEDEFGAASPLLVEALQKMLEARPLARWALDRVKLMLGAQARWDELFRVYDRAIAATSDSRDADAERAALLDEAAFAAKDLAGQPERAVLYLESIHAMRPDNAAVDAALERLYEKLGHTSALIELLGERLARSSGGGSVFHRREVLRRLTSLWMDLGNAGEAMLVAERMLADGAPLDDVVDLLERIATAPAAANPTGELGSAQRRAIAVLRPHYEAAVRVDDVVRMAERELALAGDDERRAACVKDLVGLRLAAAERAGGGVFAPTVSKVEADVKNDAVLAKVAFEALLQRALVAWKQPAPATREDAAEGAWQAIRLLTDLLLRHKKGEGALSLLTRAVRLPFDRPRRRELARQAAVVCADHVGDAARAIQQFADLFAEDGSDEAAATSLPRFAALLEQAGELARLASLWEAQAEVHARAGRLEEERGCAERAARLWEKLGEVDKALAAYERAGALGSQPAFEALARLHTERGAWPAAAEALEWLFARTTPEGRARRALELADAYVALGDRDRARSRLEAALEVDATASHKNDATASHKNDATASHKNDATASHKNDGARVEAVAERLLALYREDAAWRPLARLLAAQARRPGHPERRLAWLREASDLHWRELDEPDEAAALLELAVSWYPQDASLRLALAEVFESVGRWDRAAAVLRDQIALHRGQRSKERALVHRRVARALARAGRTADALAELRLAAEMHPAHAGILYDLGQVAATADQLDLAESTYRALLLALHRVMDEGDAAGGAPPHRAEVFVELSEIAARKNDLARAADLVESAVDAALETGVDPKPFEEPLARRGRHALLARAAERRIERGATLAARAAALRDLAGLWTEQLGRAPELAARIAHHAGRLSRELEHEGLTDGAAWAALAETHGALGDDAAKAALLRRRAQLLASAIPALSRGPQRNRLRIELAGMLLADPTRVEEALALLSSALEDDAHQPEAAAALADGLERLGRDEELAAVLERSLRDEAQREGGLSAQAVQMAWRRARALDRAGRGRDAASAYEAVIDRLPAEALGDVIDRLAALGSDRVADGLERMLAAGAGDPGSLAQRLLDLRDRAGDAAGARRALELGFAADPSNTALFHRLVDAYRDVGDPTATLRVLDPVIDAKPNALDLRLLRSEARERLGDEAGALLDLEVAARADERHVGALLALHERALERHASGAIPAEADAAAIRVVDVLVAAGRDADARRELDRVLARRPNQPDALERLGALHQAAETPEGWAAAIGVYGRLAGAAGAQDPARLERAALAMADAAERAGNPGVARDALERALASAPDSHAVMQRLERVCELTGDVARLAHLLVFHAEKHQVPDERARLLARAATLLLDGGDAAAALRVADLARAADPESHEALLVWATAQRQAGNPHAAVAEIERAVGRAKGRRTPFLARLHLEAAQSHLAVDEIVEAYEALKAGFSVDWRNPDLSLLLGLVAIDVDDDRTAERALSGLPSTPHRETPVPPPPGSDVALQANAFYRLALIGHAKGDRAKARRLATRAIGLDPEHAGARALLDPLEGGSSASRSGPRPAVTPRS